MPKIKRWFPVSHDINHSGTMRELAREFGLSGWRIWLEILSISDRCGECIDCTSQGALSRLTSAAETRLSTTSAVLQWLLRHDCVATVDELKHITRVVNYRDFHRTEERKPLPPDLPDHTKPDQTIPKPKRTVIDDLSFRRFWEIYPKKVGKDAAYRAWCKEAKYCSDVQDNIFAALEWQIGQAQWTKDNGQYIPNPATWLNQGRWKDSPPPKRADGLFNGQLSERTMRILKRGL